MSKKLRATTRPAAAVQEASAPASSWIGWQRTAVRAAFGLAAFFVLWAILLSMAQTMSGRRFSGEGWGGLASVIAENRVAAMYHAAGFFLAGAAGLWLLLGPRFRTAPWRRHVATALVVLVCGDVLLLSRHYVDTMPLESLKANEVIQLLQQSSPVRRVALVSQEGFYNYWLTYLFPYHGIRTINVTQMPRMPQDYKAYLDTVGRHTLRFWELSAVELVMGPAGLWSQVQNAPEMKDKFALAFAYSVFPMGGGYQVQPGSAQRPGDQVVLRLLSPAPRFALAGAWQEMPDEDALKKLADPAFTPFETALVAPESVKDLPALPAPGSAGTVQVVEYRAGYVKLKVNAERAALLRFAEKFDPGWRAWVNGQEVPVRRVDFISQGVYVDLGVQEVLFKFAPPSPTLWAQLAALAVCLGAAAMLIRRKRSPTAPAG